MQVGDILGQRYRLDEHVDGGAMGEVWKGTDTRLNRQVAVKILHAALSTTPEFRKRFGAEARAAAALRAPGVVDLYDYGEDHPDDVTVISYLVMEFVDGTALSKVLAERGKMSPGDTMTMVANCAKALDAAHQAGVIHRDVKPGNILLLDDGSIKIVDFGIARAHGEAGLTGTGQVMGTVAYVSPEQLYDEELTGASDLYSLGVVAYECLTGVKPFTGDAPAIVIDAKLQQDPPPLPDEVPPQVADVVMRCLAKDPQDRWRNGTELAKRCRAVAARLPHGDATEPMETVADTSATVRVPVVADTVPDPEPPPAGPGITGQRRHRRLIAVTAVILILLGVGTTVVWRSWDQPAMTEPVDDPTTSDEPSTTPSEEPTGDAPVIEDDDGWDEPSESEWPSQPGPESPTDDSTDSGDPPTDDDDGDDDDDDGGDDGPPDDTGGPTDDTGETPTEPGGPDGG